MKRTDTLVDLRALCLQTKHRFWFPENVYCHFGQLLCRKTALTQEKCLFTIAGFIPLNTLYWGESSQGLMQTIAPKKPAHHCELAHMGGITSFYSFSRKTTNKKANTNWNSQRKSHTHKDSTTLTDGSEFDCWNAADRKPTYHRPSLVPLTDIHYHFCIRPNIPAFLCSSGQSSYNALT